MKRMLLVCLVCTIGFGSVRDVNAVDTTIKAATVTLAGAILVKYAPSLVNDVKKILK